MGHNGGGGSLSNIALHAMARPICLSCCNSLSLYICVHLLYFTFIFSLCITLCEWAAHAAEPGTANELFPSLALALRLSSPELSNTSRLRSRAMGASPSCPSCEASPSCCEGDSQIPNTRSKGHCTSVADRLELPVRPTSSKPSVGGGGATVAVPVASEANLTWEDWPIFVRLVRHPSSRQCARVGQ